MTAGDQPPVVVAILGPTASGKSALGLALARRFDGEIVACDSTAVYRGFDIGTDKVPVEEQGGIPHHCVDSVGPAAEYTAADYARDAMAAIRSIHARGRLPILVGGTGLYYRALARGIFPGPGRDDRVRGRLDAMAARRGPERLHRLLGRIDPPSASRIQARDRIRIVRALEVYFQSGRTLTDHFADTRAPLAGWTIIGFAVHPPWEDIVGRIARRVDAQFARGHRRRGARAPRAGRAAGRTAVHGIRLPPRARGRARRTRSRVRARPDRDREPALRAAPVDLVPQRA